MSAEVPQTVLLTISVKIPIEVSAVTADQALVRVSERFDYSARQYTDVVEFFNKKGMYPLFEFSIPNDLEKCK